MIPAAQFAPTSNRLAIHSHEHGHGRFYANCGWLQARGLRRLRCMAQIIATYGHLLTSADGRAYTARACGRRRDDALWEGWLEFVPADGSPVIRSARETTQPNLADLEYWASGLTAVYLDGALERTLTPPPVSAVPQRARPAHNAPAPPLATDDRTPVANAILDPFAVYAKGETLLRRQLAALAARHLRNIVRAYELAPDLDLEDVDEPELIELIVTAVRGRRAA
jgi:hypothetical protein